jgi:hypothetical protein
LRDIEREVVGECTRFDEPFYFGYVGYYSCFLFKESAVLHDMGNGKWANGGGKMGRIGRIGRMGEWYYILAIVPVLKE